MDASYVAGVVGRGLVKVFVEVRKQQWCCPDGRAEPQRGAMTAVLEPTSIHRSKANSGDVTRSSRLVGAGKADRNPADESSFTRQTPGPCQNHPTGKPALRSIRGALSDESGLPTPPAEAPLHRAERGRIVRSEYLRLASLEPAQRSALLDQLYRVYAATVSGYTRDEFTRGFFGAGEISVALHYGERDELAGFAFASIERIEHAGRTHAVFNAVCSACSDIPAEHSARCSGFDRRCALSCVNRARRWPLHPQFLTGGLPLARRNDAEGLPEPPATNTH